MNDELLLSKFEALRKDSPRVVFGYTYYQRQIEDQYIALHNMRLEIVQVNEGKVLYTRAAPVLNVHRGVSSVVFCDRNVVFITSGPRSNILLKAEYLKENEEATQAAHFGTEEVTCDSSTQTIATVVHMLTGKPFPGLSMRLPDFYRMTKNPERIRLNINKELLENLGLENCTDQEVIKQKFLENINTIAGRTEKGYVIPLAWCYSGGMLAVDKRDLGRTTPKITYIRTIDFLRQYVRSHAWEVQ